MFVAVWPDGPTRERLASLDRRLGWSDEQGGPGLRVVRPEAWHVTLRFLGDVDPALLPALVDGLGVVARSVVGPVRGRVGPATRWVGSGRVLLVPVAGFDEVAAAVRSATLPLVPGEWRGEPRFSGHLTLARVSRRGLGQEERAALAGVPVASSFEVDHVDLVASDLSAEGPRYAVVARVPLGE